jgi:hypothetical protein
MIGSTTKVIRAETNELALPSSGVAGQYRSLSKINGCVTSAVPSRRSTCFPIRCYLEKESNDEEKQYRTDGSVDDCADHSRTDVDA